MNRNPQPGYLTPHNLRSRMLAAASLSVALLAVGCGGNMPSNFGVPVGGGSSSLHLTGIVHGGQQAVSGSTIQLYTVGTSGIKSASTGLIGATVTTDTNGNFAISGDYSCTGATPGTQVYITASQGNAGAGGNNPNLTMTAALGSCATLLANAASTFITINEVTTVAAAYGLAPYASSLTSVGATGSNPTGLVNAFANAALLANTASGSAGGANLAAGVTVPTSEINTLANIIAACVNTTGSGSMACNQLFTATGASDTFGAALAIAQNPSAYTSLYSLSTATSPFQPTLSGQPADFSIAVTYAGTGSTLATPYAVAIDGSGNAWVANEGGSTIAEFSPTGSVLATPTATGLYGAQGIAIDKTSTNVWVANTAGNSVVQFPLTSGVAGTPNIYTGNGISAPSAIGLDSAGNAFIANFNGNSVTELSPAGANMNGSPFTGSSNNIVNPTSIAIGLGSGAAYVTSANGYVVKLSNTGAYNTTLNDSALQGPVAVTVVATAEVVATGYTTGTSVAAALGEYANNGPATSNSPVATSFTSVGGIATDFTSFYVTNAGSAGGLLKYAYNATTPISPASGYGSLNAPVGVAVDNSGSVWTTNSGSNTLSKFIGLAAATTTPIAANVGP